VLYIEGSVIRAAILVIALATLGLCLYWRAVPWIAIYHRVLGWLWMPVG